jgi:hypothetical protein
VVAGTIHSSTTPTRKLPSRRRRRRTRLRPRRWRSGRLLCDTSSVEPTEHRVAVVVDPTFGERVIELAHECHVWLVRSPVNDEVGRHTSRRSVRVQLRTWGLDVQCGGVTRSVVLGGPRNRRAAPRRISHDPPLSVLRVVGLSLSTEVKDALSDYGFHEVESSQDGFVARRAADPKAG